MRFGHHFGPIWDSEKRAVDLTNQGNPIEGQRFLWLSHVQLDSVVEPVFGTLWDLEAKLTYQLNF